MARRPFGEVVQYTGVIDCFLKLWNKEGLSGFYKGALPSVIKVWQPKYCMYNKNLNNGVYAYFFYLDWTDSGCNLYNLWVHAGTIETVMCIVDKVIFCCMLLMHWTSALDWTDQVMSSTMYVWFIYHCMYSLIYTVLCIQFVHFVALSAFSLFKDIIRFGICRFRTRHSISFSVFW